MEISNHINQKENVFPLKPYHLVSLWDMLRFYADRFLGINHALDMMRFEFTANGLRHHDFSENGKDRAGLEAFLRLLHTMLSELHLPMSAKQALHCLKSFEYADRVDDKLCDETFALYRRIKDEFENQLFFMIPPNKASLYESGATFFDKRASDRFPDLLYDMDEACKCYALGRTTACVFHLMRIMERGVQVFGDLLGVTSTAEKVWQTIIGDIRKAVEKKYPDRKQVERIKYENVLAHLETIKIAWRNPTMHPKNTYTEEEAEGIIHAVKIFMGDLTKLV
jgi:hypothetical protein